MKRMILASGSPRRKELLQMLEVPFEVLVSDTKEVIIKNEPAEVTKELSYQKAMAVAGQVEEGIIIGADTVVSIDGKILGKPADKEEAREMIYKLQGKSHMVYTGVTVIAKSDDMVSASSFAEGTKVNVAPMTENEIEASSQTLKRRGNLIFRPKNHMIKPEHMAFKACLASLLKELRGTTSMWLVFPFTGCMKN